jgi:transposase-like protein
MNQIKQANKWQGAMLNQDEYLANIIQEAIQKAIHIQFLRHIGADEYERTEERQGHRNGYYTRQLQTRVGSISLHVCRDREGNFQQDVFERYQRSEKALVLTVSEMYFTGVSTRKVEGIMEELCGMNVSKSQVSTLTAKMDSLLKEWRERPLIENYKYLIVDARYEKVRDNGRIVSKAAVVAVGITAKGAREVIGTWIVNSESYEAWDSCIASLKERGLQDIEYVVSDENKGLRKALMKHFQGALLQRCQVHFMRNFIGKLSKKDQREAINLLQDVFAADAKNEAMRRLQGVIAYLLNKKKEDVASWLEDSIEETLMVLELPTAHRKKMKSTNMLERVNQELKRRTRVVRIFPNEQSCLRMLTALCQEISENWGDRRYLNMDDM